jgi:hypothetical protein
MVRMPNGIGLGNESAHKYRNAEGLLPMTIRMAMGALRNRPSWVRPYVWLDLTSGPGFHLLDGKQAKGTPVIALEALVATGMPFYAVFLESNSINADQLRRHLVQRFGPEEQAQTWFKVHHGDSHTVAARLLAEAPGANGLGGIVYDPTKAVDFDLLKTLAEVPGRKRYDLLVYLSATSIKRPRNLPLTYLTDRRSLLERLVAIGKGTWVVREPAGVSQWTWLVGSEWLQMPAWNKAGFHPWTSARGREILTILDMTRSERQSFQQPSLGSIFDNI